MRHLMPASKGRRVVWFGQSSVESIRWGNIAMELNKTMGELKIGPNVVISARKDSTGMYNVVMPKLKGDTLEKLWPNMI